MPTKRRYGSLLVSLLLLAVAGGIWWQRWAVYDFIRLYGYQPPAQIVALANNTTMDDGTQRLFYVYHPNIEDNVAFNTHCKGQEKTIVLGCYIQNRGIYLYQVTDKRLDGILEVTAAHEVLHAKYDRLSSKDRKYVSGLLERAYAKVVDERIKETIENYRKNGADVTNELHSILGTEVRDLPEELEDYYKRYFSDRAKIVGYSEQYEAVFTAQKQRLAEIEAQLTQIKAQIDGLEAEIEASYAALQRDRSRITTQEQADAFNAHVDSYNADVRQLNRLVAEYNALVDEYKTLAVEQKSLYQAIDSKGTIAPQ